MIKELTIDEDMDKSNTFNSFYSSVFTKEDMSHLPDLSRKLTQKDLDDVHFCSDDVLKQLSNLKPDKSPGPDMTDPQLLK